MRNGNIGTVRPQFELYLQQEIELTTAALGGEVEVPGLDSNPTLEVPEGTQTGAVFRITGDGGPAP